MKSSLRTELRATSRITDVDTDEVRELVLYVDEPSFRFREGQAIEVIVPGTDEFGSNDHARKYSIVKGNQVANDEGVELTILVRRCFYIDDFNGERYPGRASNYLCDAKVGDSIAITGPYRSAFSIPENKSANILMIGTGTGIAPFRAFIGQIYKEKAGWDGQVRLFYGAKTGLDLLYMNDENNDLANYYQEETFQAFNALTRRPLSGDEKALEHSLEENLQEAWQLIKETDTYVFVAGLEKIAPSLDAIMIDAAGSKEAWESLKQQKQDDGRWATLLYN